MSEPVKAFASRIAARNDVRPIASAANVSPGLSSTVSKKLSTVNDVSKVRASSRSVICDRRFAFLRRVNFRRTTLSANPSRGCVNGASHGLSRMKSVLKIWPRERPSDFRKTKNVRVKQSGETAAMCLFLTVAQCDTASSGVDAHRPNSRIGNDRVGDEENSICTPEVIWPGSHAGTAAGPLLSQQRFYAPSVPFSELKGEMRFWVRAFCFARASSILNCQSTKYRTIPSLGA